MNIHHRFIVSLLLIGFPILGLSTRCYGIQSVDDPAATENPTTDSLPVVIQPETQFLRLQTDEYQNPIALQTATAKYVLENEEGEVELEVFLEGVVHIADTSYYRSFQQRFERYDIVLCESPIEPKEKEPAKKTGLSAMSMLQQLSSGTLGLAYQSDEIDYNAGNLIFADLTPQEISGRMKEQGDDQVTLIADLLAHIIKKMNVDGKENETESEADSQTSDDLEPKRSITIDLNILTDPNGIMKIRRLMATVLVESRLLESSLPPSIHKIIIGDRNDHVMASLEQAKLDGKRRVAVFFGVGNMPDLEKRLVSEYGMKLDSVNWRNAWDLRDGSIEGAPLEGLVESAFRDSFKNKMRRFARSLRNQDESDDSEKGKEMELEKNKKIDDLEKTLKALQEKLKKMEKQGDGGQ